MVFMKKIDYINLYKRAWENHDMRILEKIFHQNIIYEESPTNIIIGIEALKRYWKENKRKQKNVQFKPINYTINKNNIVVKWNASFIDVTNSKSAKLEGIMWLIIENEKIRQFKERYNITFE